MRLQYLGNSGLKISEITYGNWLTHGSKVENDVATSACGPRSTPASTFDTADVYANTAAETVLGEALKGERRESLEIFTKVYWPTGPRATTTSACPASTSWSRSTARCDGCRRTTSTSTRRTATTTRRRSRRRCRPSPTSSGRARRSTSASASGPPSRSARATRCAKELGFQLISNQPQYSMLWRVIEARSSRRAKSSASRRSSAADRAGRAHRQVPPGQPAPEGSRATDEKGGAEHDQAVHERRRPRPACRAQARSPRTPG